MNKSDIRLEVDSRSKGLREWADRLREASPALADLFYAEAAYIQDHAKRYDSYGATMMMGKVNGMIAAAHTLMEEWSAYR